MECIEVWKADCEVCGVDVVFPVEKRREGDYYTCRCKTKYIIDRSSGHFHKVDNEVQQIEAKEES